jgi:manganese/zinc/iron transport system permease protein
LLASIACAIIGCFLVLRRMSLMGDAISHAVLPGIVIAFLISKSLSALPMFIGAAIVGVMTAGLSELVHRMGKVEIGASMGVVFTVLFALGVILLEQFGGDGVHLDAECVLYGAMEHVLWLNPPTHINELFTAGAWEHFPPQLVVLGLALCANIAFIGLCFKELRITAFDPGLAAAQGINPAIMHYGLMTFVAITTVAAFEAVGSILVVAMLIVPGLCAHLLVNRLSSMIWLSAAVAVIASTSGYGAAAKFDLNAAGMIGVMLGVILAITVVASPRVGLVAQLRKPALTNPVSNAT